jgi:hypothetical protein
MADRLGPELAPHLRRELGEERLAAQFSAIEQGLAARRRRRRGGGAVVLVVVVLLVAALVIRDRLSTSEPEPRWRGQVATTEDAPRTLVLADGSSLALAPATRARLCDAEPGDVCVALDHGAVEFAVSRDPGRSFWVEAGEVRVRVVGTRFVVEHEPNPVAGGRVAVIVHEGIVEVDVGDGGTRRLAAGERWERRRDDGRDARVGAPPATTAPKPPPSLTPEPDAAAPALAPSESSPAQALPRTSASEEPAAEPSAADLLWAEARAARREGSTTDEAAAYAELLRGHPRDPRTGLAAFELGRLRMDELGDLAGAITALERAIALGGAASPYHEDSLARLVRAYTKRGATAKCQVARAEYLSAYPEGVHAAMVRSQCPP